VAVAVIVVVVVTVVVVVVRIVIVNGMQTQKMKGVLAVVQTRQVLKGARVWRQDCALKSLNMLLGLTLILNRNES
jgi:hypothetical protein